MPQDRLPRIHMLDDNRNSWASSICFFLHRFGFAEVWTSQGVGNQRVFISTLRQRLIESFKQGWVNRIDQNENGRFSLYASLKSEPSLSPYLSEVKHIMFKTYISRFRMGVSQFNTHRHRYKVNPSPEIFCCPFCVNIVENEIHFMFCCPMYSDLRLQLIESKYFSRPSKFRLAVLLTSEKKNTMINVGPFLYRAFERRAEMIP